jgi:hypothetical protein
VTMPETTVCEQYGSSCRKHEVWHARNIASMQPKSEAASVQSATKSQFGRGILALDCSHHLAALVTRNDVNHRL